MCARPRLCVCMYVCMSVCRNICMHVRMYVRCTLVCRHKHIPDTNPCAQLDPRAHTLHTVTSAHMTHMRTHAAKGGSPLLSMQHRGCNTGIYRKGDEVDCTWLNPYYACLCLYSCTQYVCKYQDTHACTHTHHIFIRICVHVYTQRFYVSTQTRALQMDVHISTSVPAWFLKACECQAHIMCSSVDATCAKLVMCCIGCVVSCGVYYVKIVVCAGCLHVQDVCMSACMHGAMHTFMPVCRHT